MKTLSVAVWCVALAGCAVVSESYRVPRSVPPRAVFPHLATLVKAKGIAVNEQKTEVTFMLSETSRVYYLDVEGQLELKVFLPEEVPPAERAAKFADLKTRAITL